LTFSFEVLDGKGKIAEGTHERVIVNKQKFLANAQARQKV
jgi:predicted thioesterase